MSALGQKQTCAVQTGMSALPPKATLDAECPLRAKSRMVDRLGVDVIVPKAEEIDQIHNTYMDVFYERSTPAQIDGLPQVACTFIARDRCCRRSGAAGRAISVSA